MALTYTTYEDNNGSGIEGGDVTTASRTYNAGELVVVLWVGERETPGNGTVSVSNSGTAQSWTALPTIHTLSYCYLRGWWCVMSATQEMTITCASTDIYSCAGMVYTLVHAGQHATTPVPAGKIYSGTDADGDVSQSITPTASGSCLWMITGDWNNGTDTYAPATDCTKHDSYALAGALAVGLFRPTTQPRTDANAFTVGETDTNGKISWMAFEVQAAAATEVPTGTSGGLVVGSETSFVGEGFVGAIEAAGNTQPTGLATETDTAQPLARQKTKGTQLATETDAALALVAKHARAVGLATQTDTALAGGRQKAKVTALASEADTALALGRKKTKPVGIAIETDSALAVSRRKTRSAGRSDEIDAALALGAPLGVGLASETDSALAPARRKAKAAQLASTTETALALTPRKVRLCGTAAETDAALALARGKVRACGRADETDAAFACPPFGVIARPVGLAVEMDEALALAALVLSEAELPRGGDDVPDRGHRGWDRKRSRLKLRREREFTEQIRDLYRELTGDPRTAERAEAILAPVVAAIPAGGESEAAREAAIEARADALRARADAFEANALQAEIALRLLHRELRDWQEADDLQAIRPLLAQVL